MRFESYSRVNNNKALELTKPELIFISVNLHPGIIDLFTRVYEVGTVRSNEKKNYKSVPIPNKFVTKKVGCLISYT